VSDGLDKEDVGVRVERRSQRSRAARRSSCRRRPKDSADPAIRARTSHRQTPTIRRRAMPRDATEQPRKSKRPAVNVLNAIMGANWAMEEYALRTMLEIAARENLSPEAVAAQLGRPLDNTHASPARWRRDDPGDRAAVPLRGLLHRDLRRDDVRSARDGLHAALDDRAVRAILLEIDSPRRRGQWLSQLAAMVASRARHKARRGVHQRDRRERGVLARRVHARRSW
jgi:hypothetical protein